MRDQDDAELLEQFLDWVVMTPQGEIFARVLVTTIFVAPVLFLFWVLR